MLWCFLVCCVAKIDIPVFDDAAAAKLQLNLDAAVSLYSTSFNEECVKEETAPTTPEIVQMHAGNLENYANWSYLYPDYLDNPFTGQVLGGDYTQTNKTVAFIRDGESEVTPHTRAQTCHYALRLTKSAPQLYGAAYYHTKQRAAFGFKTRFHFEVLHRNKICELGGKASQWCHAHGADGFAFVIQNGDMQEKTISDRLAGLGYTGINKALVIEFDMHRDVSMKDIDRNHISVHIPPVLGNKVTANHYLSSIAYTADIPDLQVGKHFVEISYDILSKWDQMYKHHFENLFDERWVSSVSPEMVDGHFGRAGLLTVSLNGKMVLSTMVDLAMIVEVDGAEAHAKLPGAAWVGFTASTSLESWMSVDILDWFYEDTPPCTTTCVVCHRFKRRSLDFAVPDATKTYMDSGSAAIDGESRCVHFDDHMRMVIKNVGTTNVHISARYSATRAHEVEQCYGGADLRWNQLQPYFLGCEKVIEYIPDLAELWLNSDDGTRSLKVSDPHILNRPDMVFKRKGMFTYCVVEHTYNPTLFHIAHCNCKYCEHLFNLQYTYSVYFQHKCEERFGTVCQCLEVSSMEIQMHKPKYMRTPVCRGCTYTSQCTYMLKAAQCARAEDSYILGNPLAPTLEAHGFQNRLLDEGRVTDGRLRGDICICEPKYVRFHFVQGTCTGYSQKLIEEILTDGTVDDCYDKCASINNCNYFTFYEEGANPGKCVSYQSCEDVNCDNEGGNCIYGVTYRMAELGTYANTRGGLQANAVYLNSTVQTTWESCVTCLQQFDAEHCAFHCGPPSSRTFAHYPAGQSCSTCIFAGNMLYDLDYEEHLQIKKCAYDAISRAEDPWTACASWDTLNLFNGVATHFMTECPGRKFHEYGVVCAPNLYAVNHFPLQILSRPQAVNNTAWSLDDNMCLNAICEVVPRKNCYVKLSRWNFKESVEDTIGFLDLYAHNGAVRDEMGMQLNKSKQHYFTTPILPLSLREFSIEAWVTIAASEKTENLVLKKTVEASSYWREDYMQSLAVDGDMKSYWSARIQPAQDPFLSYWEVDLGKDSFVEATEIYWKSAASRFSVLVAMNIANKEDAEWQQIYSKERNEDVVTIVDYFFKARWLRIQITAAGQPVKTPFSTEKSVDYMVSIYEVVILLDKDISRLHTTESTFHYNFGMSQMIDGNPYSYWSSVRHKAKMTILINFATYQDEVHIISIHWQTVPSMFIARAEDCSTPISQFIQLAVTTVGRHSFRDEVWSGGCMLIQVNSANPNYFGEKMIQIRELEIYGADASVLIVSDVHYDGQLLDASHPPMHAVDNDPTTYWLFNVDSDVGAAILSVEFEAPSIILLMEFTFALLGGIYLCPSAYFFEISLDGVEWEKLGVEVETSTCLQDAVKYLFTTKYIRVIFAGAGLSNTDEGRRIAFQDWRFIHSLGNLANPSTINVDSEWVDFAPLDATMPQPHFATRANDGDMDTWWGAEFGKQFSAAGIEAMIELQFPSIVRIGVVVVYWRWPPEQLTIACDNTRVTSQMAKQYISAVVFSDRDRRCEKVQVLMSNPDTAPWLEKPLYAGHSVLGIREVQLYAIAQIKMVSPDDARAREWIGSDMSIAWENAEGQVATFDLEERLENWSGIYIEWTSVAAAPPALDLLVSDSENSGYQLIDTITKSQLLEVYTLKTFSGRYLRLVTYDTPYIIKTLSIFEPVNLALQAVPSANTVWDHSSNAAVDGSAQTFWLSEPEASNAEWSVDLSGEFVITDDIYIDWKLPARNFAVYLSFDTITWTLLAEITDNTENSNIVSTNFEARYVKIVMTAWNQFSMENVLYQNQPLYGLNQVRIMFDVNLVHGKSVNATHTVPTSQMSIEKATDYEPPNSSVPPEEQESLRTTWMPKMGLADASVLFNLTNPTIVSGVNFLWRVEPGEFKLSAYNTTADTWYDLPGALWSVEKVRTLPNTEITYRTGFGPVTQFRMNITRVGQFKGDQGLIVGLQDVYYYTPMHESILPRLARDRSQYVATVDKIDNEAYKIGDGNTRYTYWSVPTDWDEPATIKIIIDKRVLLGRIKITWRRICNHFRVFTGYDARRSLVREETDNSALVTDIYLLETTDWVELELLVGEGHFAVYEMQLFEAELKHPQLIEESPPWVNSPSNIIDRDPESYWLAPPGVFPVVVEIDLENIYPVSGIDIFWTKIPPRYNVEVSVDTAIWKPVAMESDRNVFGRSRMKEITVERLRYFRVSITSPYREDSGFWSTAIRDIICTYAQNLARLQPAYGDSVWDYPPENALDGNDNTFWAGKLNTNQGTLIVSLGEVRNLAGFRFLFAEKIFPKDYKVDYSQDCVTFETLLTKSGNKEVSVYIPTTTHFSAKCIKLEVGKVSFTTRHPDTLDIENAPTFSLLVIREIEAFEHTGGGGVFGIEMDNGKVFSTIVYGQQQPRTWTAGSEGDVRTASPPSTATLQDVGEEVQIVATFREDRNGMAMISLYRNGEQYGMEYISGDSVSWDNARLIFGVRSSLFATRTDDLKDVGMHSDTHSAFFEGTIHSATLIKGYLAAEEVHGLFLVPKGLGKELGCHCYDACPVGSSRFYPGVPVPCSGQGACLRSPTGEHFSKGSCLCIPGYSGDACQYHCSEISASGCCLSDNDCREGTSCDADATQTCIPSQ